VSEPSPELAALDSEPSDPLSLAPHADAAMLIATATKSASVLIADRPHPIESGAPRNADEAPLSSFRTWHRLILREKSSFRAR
jgi:hypothetical protein